MIDKDRLAQEVKELEAEIKDLQKKLKRATTELQFKEVLLFDGEIPIKEKPKYL